MSEWDAYPVAAPAAPAADPWAAFPTAAAAPEQVSGFHALGPLNDILNAESGFKEQLGRAATFGLQDKAGAVAAGINSLLSGGSFSDAYHDELSKERGAGNTYAENHPIASKVATTLGTVAAMSPQSTVRAAGFPFRPVGQIGNVSVPQGIGEAVKQGAAAGGLTGFGNANDESVASDLEATGKGMLGGGATAGVAQAAAPAASAALTSLMNSHLMHKASLPGLAIGLLELFHNPHYALPALGGLSALYGASQVPTRAWQAMLPILATQGAAATPGLLSRASEEPGRQQ